MSSTITINLADEAATTALGERLARAARPGDVAALYGDLGAGKTTLARGLIRALAGPETEAPSPTFTLVQTYPTEPPIWHFDLYRLTDPREARELGLEEAVDGLALIEWPERLGTYLPPRRLEVRLDFEGEGRIARLVDLQTGAPASMATGGNLRDSEIVEFLTRAGWGEASRTPLTADASTRRYERLRRKTETAMLMDAPPLESVPCPPDATDEERVKLGWNAISRLAASRVEAFVAVAGHLKALGLCAPGILEQDASRGLALLEDLGDDLFARVIERGGDEIELYTAAGDVLAAVHRAPVPKALPYRGGEWPILTFDHLALSANVDLFIEWMPKRDLDIRISEQTRIRWERVRENLVAKAEDIPRALIMRDTHAENFLWLPHKQGLQRVGLLDFQDAVLGWGEWDMSMLLQDARRDVSQAAREATIRAYLDGTGGRRADFDERLAVLGAMNMMRIMGIFARLVVRDGKPRYDQFQPRLRGLLNETLSHPSMAEARDFVVAVAPHLLVAP